jgi:hypothetical protein
VIDDDAANRHALTLPTQGRCRGPRTATVPEPKPLGCLRSG